MSNEDGSLEAEDFLDEDGKWKCIQCGACCLNVTQLLPEFATSDGSCKHLTPDNRCDIYKDRPEVCRVDKLGMTDVQLASSCAAIVKHIWGDN